MQAALVIAAWLPIFAFWLLITVIYARITLLEALPRTAATIGVAALIGIGVWMFCARRPWPHQVRISFYAGHLAAAFAYAALWTFSLYAVEPLFSGVPALTAIRNSQVLGWQLLMGLLVYGVIAGVSYGIQTQRRARENERRALQAEASLKAARLEALQNRLHPHFLFNALHTVAALVRDDPAEAEQAVEKLGDMLRYTLRDGNGDRVPFSEEWEFTKRYLEFEELRFGERLRVSTEVDPECHACSLPPFSLQTLVENAVRHSIAPRAEGGLIEILARAGAAHLDVGVRDDGIGGAGGTSDGTRTGLRALRERLSAVYGGSARLTIGREPSGFFVFFSVPRTITEDDREDGQE